MKLISTVPDSLSSATSSDLQGDSTFSVPNTIAECHSASFDLIELARDKIHEGYWRDVPIKWRQLFTLATLLKIAALIVQDHISVAIEACDNALLLGAPIQPFDFVTKLASDLQRLKNTSSAHSTTAERMHAGHKHSADDDQDEGEHSSFCVSLESGRWPLGGAYSAIEDDIALVIEGKSAHALARIDSPSLMTFEAEYMEKGIPVVITGGMTHWPALSRWRNLKYLEVRIVGSILNHA